MVRGSDAVAGNAYTFLSSMLVLGMICVGLVPLVIGAAAAGWWLGQERKQLAVRNLS